MKIALAGIVAARVSSAASPPLTVDQTVDLALAANLEVRSAEGRWHAAEHQVLPNYAPADPSITYANVQSPTGITKPSDLSLSVSQPLQFPGKALLQGRSATRAADIARFTYEAARRDVRARAETSFYQLLLDQALRDVGAANVKTLRQVLAVTQVGYSTGRVTQLDFITAEFNLSAAEQQQSQLDVAIATDRANLNEVLGRAPDEPLEIDGRLDIAPIRSRIDELTEAARRARQEILEAALTAENAEAALTLAKLEYAPDFTLGYGFDRFQLSSASPDNVHLATHTFSIGMTMPVFFWLRQKEDVESARASLGAARADFRTIELQTSTLVTNLYRQADLAYRTALLYRDSLVPLARQAVNVALVAYQGGKIDFVALSNALQQQNGSQVTYLQQANQFLAGRIALEQAVGQPVPK